MSVFGQANRVSLCVCVHSSSTDVSSSVLSWSVFTWLLDVFNSLSLLFHKFSLQNTGLCGTDLFQDSKKDNLISAASQHLVCNQSLTFSTQVMSSVVCVSSRGQWSNHRSDHPVFAATRHPRQRPLLPAQERQTALWTLRKTRHVSEV